MNRLESIRSMALEKRQQLCAELHALGIQTYLKKNGNLIVLTRCQSVKRGI